MNANKTDLQDIWIDPDDAPELTGAFFEQADEFIGETLVRRGRPVASKTKQATTIRLDPDVLEAFKASGKGWQTRMNDALKEWLAAHQYKVIT